MGGSDAGHKGLDIRSGSFEEVMPDRVADKVHHTLYVKFLEDVHAELTYLVKPIAT
jgi:hypothetical protein